MDVMRSLVLLLVMTSLAIVVTIDGRQVDEDFYDELLRGERDEDSARVRDGWPSEKAADRSSIEYGGEDENLLELLENSSRGKPSRKSPHGCRGTPTACDDDQKKTYYGGRDEDSAGVQDSWPSEKAADRSSTQYGGKDEDLLELLVNLLRKDEDPCRDTPTLCRTDLSGTDDDLSDTEFLDFLEKLARKKRQEKSFAT